MHAIIVGQAPAASSGPDDLPLEGRAGERLARLAGLEGHDELTSFFAVCNVLPRFPGRAGDGKGDLFPRAAAREAAASVHAVLGEEEWDRVLLLGGRVAESMGLAEAPYLTWLAPTTGGPDDVRARATSSRRECYRSGLWLVPARFEGLVWPDARFAVVPHPSGVSHWWNEPENFAAARRFLSGSVAELCA